MEVNLLQLIDRQICNSFSTKAMYSIFRLGQVGHAVQSNGHLEQNN
jgi:hypothetical protein